jgi:chemotaxis protein methyltransferase CheR
LRPTSDITKPAKISLSDGEYPFTLNDFRQIASILRADVGITLTEAKAPLVYARLVKRLRALGLESFRSYCALIATNEGVDERRKMMTSLTTNVTRFFREPHHFEHLKTQVLPALVARARKGGRVRIWSAGCSSGEEPYSIGLTILNLLPDAARHDVKILATDVDPDILDAAREALYPASALEPVSLEDRARGFQHVVAASGRKLWQVAPALRNLVSFRELNLIAEWPMRGPFDAVFCRNTVIYFDEEVQTDIWRRMPPLMAPGGILYIGHSERVLGTDALRAVGMTTYQNAGGS